MQVSLLIGDDSNGNEPWLRMTRIARRDAQVETALPAEPILGILDQDHIVLFQHRQQ